MILIFRTDKSGQTVQTQIRLLLKEQSDQGIHCLLFTCISLMKYPKLCLNFRLFTAKFSVVRKFRNFTVPCLSYLQSTVRNLPKSALVGSKRRSLGKLSIPVGKPNDVDAGSTLQQKSHLTGP